MNRTLPKALLLVSLTLVGAMSLLASNEPIPGVDIIVQKKPGGIAVANTKSDAQGKFVIDNLAAGSYSLIIGVPQAKAIVSTTRSNIKHSSATVENGVQQESVSITFEQGQERSAVVEITITANKGKITGEIILAAPPATKAGGAQR